MRDKPITCGVVEKVVSDAEGPAQAGVLLF